MVLMKVNILILGSVMVWMIVEMVLMQVNILILGSVMVWMIVEMDLMKVRTANSVLRESGNVLLYFEESSKQAVKKKFKDFTLAKHNNCIRNATFKYIFVCIWLWLQNKVTT